MFAKIRAVSGRRTFSFALSETKYDEALYKATIKDFSGSIALLEEIAAQHSKERNSAEYKQLLRKILSLSILSGNPYDKHSTLSDYYSLIDKTNVSEMQDCLNLMANYFPTSTNLLKDDDVDKLDSISKIYYSIAISIAQDSSYQTVKLLNAIDISQLADLYKGMYYSTRSIIHFWSAPFQINASDFFNEDIYEFLSDLLLAIKHFELSESNEFDQKALKECIKATYKNFARNPKKELLPLIKCPHSLTVLSYLMEILFSESKTNGSIVRLHNEICDKYDGLKVLNEHSIRECINCLVLNSLSLKDVGRVLFNKYFKGLQKNHSILLPYAYHKAGIAFSLTGHSSEADRIMHK